jgi:hypothetical protein
MFHLFQTYVAIVSSEFYKSRSRYRCGGSLLSLSGPAAMAHWCGEDRGHGHESGGDGIPRRVSHDVVQDGRGHGQRAGWDVGLHAAFVGRRRGKLRPDIRCLWSGDGCGASVGRGSWRALGTEAASGLTPRPDVRGLVTLLKISTYLEIAS